MLGLAFSLYMLMVGLPGPAVAALVNRIGVRLTLLIGSCSAMLGALSMALFVHTGWQAVISFGILIGFGSCAGGAIAEQQGIAQWFIRKRALALSLMYSGGGIGGFILPPILNRVIANSNGNWRNGWWIFLALAAIGAALVIFMVKEKPADMGQVPDGGAAADLAAGTKAAQGRVRHHRSLDLQGSHLLARIHPDAGIVHRNQLRLFTDSSPRRGASERPGAFAGRGCNGDVDSCDLDADRQTAGELWRPH